MVLNTGLLEWESSALTIRPLLHNNTAANVTATNTANNNAFGDKKLVFKNTAPFINCISKINDVKIDNAEDLDVVMPMYNLLEYSKNYRKTTGSLWNCY